MTKVAAAEAAADAEMLRMRFAIGELQAKCDRQEKELAAFRQQGADASAVVTSNTTKAQVFRDLMSSSMGVPIQGAPSAPRDRANQNGDGVMAQELDLIHREAAQKSKDLRKLQETLAMVRAELNQEKMVSDQYREQVENLEMQLKNAMQKQHRAEGERTVVEWRLRNAEGAGRLSRSCTPQPGASRSLIKAWAEPGKISEDGEIIASESGDFSGAFDDQAAARPASRGSALVGHGSAGHSRQLGGMMGDEDSESDKEESAVESDGSEDLEVFHPPPSRQGRRY